MLASVLRSDVAVQVSVRIIREFIALRRYISEHELLSEHLTQIDLKLLEHDEKIGLVIKQQEEPREKKAILFFKGQMFDATVCIENIISSAKTDIILIDGYVDTKTLELLCKREQKYSSYKGIIGKIADNEVNRHFNAKKPNTLWSTDITEFNLPECNNTKVYLSPISCFVSLLILRLLEKKPDYKIPIKTMVDSLRKANLVELADNIYKSSYCDNVIFDIGTALNLDLSKKQYSSGDLKKLRGQTKKNY